MIDRICIGTGVGDYKHYCERPTYVNDLHGVGAFVMMCAQMQQLLNNIHKSEEYWKKAVDNFYLYGI